MSMGGGAPEGSAGFTYSFDFHAGIGRGPMDELREIRMGGKLGWQGHLYASATGRIDEEYLFGGPGKEGGIVGNFHLLMGEPTQVAPESLGLLVAPAPATAFRRVVTFIYSGMLSALNPYPKVWSFRFRRALQGWDGDPIAPSLAMIQLVGQTTLPPEDTRPTLETNQAEKLPIANYIEFQVSSAFGEPITSVDRVTYDRIFLGNVGEGDQNQPVYVTVPFEATFTPGAGTTATVRVPSYMRAYGHKIVVFVNGQYVEVNLQAMTSPTRLICEVEVDYNLSMTSITKIVSRNKFFPTDGTREAPWTLLSSEPGKFVVAIDSGYATTPLFIDYVVEPSIFPQFIFNQEIGGVLETGAVIELVPANGVTFVDLLKVTEWATYSDNNPYTEAGGPVAPPPRQLSAELIQREPTIQIEVFDAMSEGQLVLIYYSYKPNFGAAFNLQPDPIIKAMNPAHIIFECLTNREWGRGHDRSVIATESFEAAAQVLFNEGFGLCLKWTRRDSISTFIQSVLDTIGAVLYSDRSTAKLTLLLIRGDYVKASLKLWDSENGLVQIKESTVNTASSLINEISVTWHDPVFNEDRSVNEQNLASLQSTAGAVNSLQKNYKGIPTAGLARRVALRDLRAQSQGLRRFQVVVDRRGWNLTPGKVMRIQDVSRGIPDMVVRIASFKDGTLQNGQITLDVVQDVFSLPAASFTIEQPIAWGPVDFTPCIGEHDVFEMPYFMLRRRMSNANFAYLTESSAFIGTVAEKAQPKNNSYGIAVRDNAPTVDDVPALGDRLYCGYQPD